MFCSASPEGLTEADEELITSLPGDDGIANSAVGVLFGIDTMRESAAALDWNKVNYNN